jgi:transposase-like protein
MLWSTEESMAREKRQFTPEERATILRRYLADKVPVSDLCDEYKIQPSLFYTWQRQLLENMSAALEDRRTRRAASTTEAAHQRKIAALETELQKKDAIIAFVSEEHLALKKKRGES